MTPHHDDLARWTKYGKDNGWELPPRAMLFWRLPVVRHIRTVWLIIRVEMYYTRVPGIRTGYDEWILFAIVKGMI